MGDSDDEDEGDEHLDHHAIILPGAGLQLGDHLDHVGDNNHDGDNDDDDVFAANHLVPASSLATTSTRSEFCWRRVRSQNVTLAVSTLSLKMLIVTMMAALMTVMCAGGDDDTDDDDVFLPTSPSPVVAIPSLVKASERPGKHWASTKSQTYQESCCSPLPKLSTQPSYDFIQVGLYTCLATSVPSSALELVSAILAPVSKVLIGISLRI